MLIQMIIECVTVGNGSQSNITDVPILRRIEIPERKRNCSNGFWNAIIPVGVEQHYSNMTAQRHLRCELQKKKKIVCCRRNMEQLK